MKKVVMLFLAGIALFAFIFATSMLWYRFFYTNPTGNNNVSSVTIQLDDDNNVIDEEGLIPLDDDTARTLAPYEFRILNTSDNDYIYDILLEDSIISDDATYSSKELLSRSQLRYQLTLNGDVIKTGNLSDIKNNILDTRVISASKTNNYQLRIYLAETAFDTNWQNKYYHFDVRVQTEE